MSYRRAPIKTAFILGAGLGVRLRPLTDTCPKPLLPVGGRPLITYAMDHLLTVGVERFIVNTHHLAHAYAEAFPDNLWRGVPIRFRHEPVLLNTGGGLKNIEDLLGCEEALWVYNGDILTDLPLERLLDGREREAQDVTLALRSDGTNRNVGVDGEDRICDFRFALGRPVVKQCLFTGIYIVERPFLKRLKAGGREDIVNLFIAMVKELPGAVGSVVIDEGTWQDIGSPEAYTRVNQNG